MQILTLILAAIPGLLGILKLIDKWVSKTPAAKAAKELKDKTEARRKFASKKNEAIKNAKKSYTKDIEDLFNRR